MRRPYPWWAPPILALQFLTRLPVPGTKGLSDAVVARGLVGAVGWFPLIGTLIGGVTAAVALAFALVWPLAVAVLLAMAAEAWLTGCFHEDAVADFVDAFGGGQSAEGVRAILKDSRIGSYGSLALIIALSLRATLTFEVLTSMRSLEATSVIVAAATFGRLLIVVLMTLVAPAPGAGGLGKDVASGVTGSTLLLALVTASPGLLAFTVDHLPLLLMAFAAGGGFLFWFRRLLLRRIGGSTGDCLGFAAYTGQILFLLAATAY